MYVDGLSFITDQNRRGWVGQKELKPEKKYHYQQLWPSCSVSTYVKILLIMRQDATETTIFDKYIRNEYGIEKFFIIKIKKKKRKDNTLRHQKPPPYTFSQYYALTGDLYQ